VLIIIGQNIKRLCSKEHRYPEGSQQLNNEQTKNLIKLCGRQTKKGIQTVNTSVTFTWKSAKALLDFDQSKQNKMQAVQLGEKGEIVQLKTSKKQQQNCWNQQTLEGKSYVILSSRSPGLMTTAPCLVSIITAARRS